MANAVFHEDQSTPPVTRKQYYNPMLDPQSQTKMTAKMIAAVNDDTYTDGGPLNTPDTYHPANLVSSLCTDDLHRPALDIDIPCDVFPSSTAGHCHIYFPTVALEWWQYAGLLTALANAGILEPKYVEHSLARGQTLLRLPGAPKVYIEKKE